MVGREFDQLAPASGASGANSTGVEPVKCAGSRRRRGSGGRARARVHTLSATFERDLDQLLDLGLARTCRIGVVAAQRAHSDREQIG